MTEFNDGSINISRDEIVQRIKEELTEKNGNLAPVSRFNSYKKFSRDLSSINTGQKFTSKIQSGLLSLLQAYGDDICRQYGVGL